MTTEHDPFARVYDAEDDDLTDDFADDTSPLTSSLVYRTLSKTPTRSRSTRATYTIITTPS